MSEVYKVPSQGVRHMLSDRSRGLFTITSSSSPIQQTGVECAYGLNYVLSKIHVS